jgi:hypothetical protein
MPDHYPIVRNRNANWQNPIWNHTPRNADRAQNSRSIASLRRVRSGQSRRLDLSDACQNERETAKVCSSCRPPASHAAQGFGRILRKRSLSRI